MSRATAPIVTSPRRRRRFDPAQTVTTKVVSSGTWGNTDYSTLGTFSIQGKAISGTAKKVEKEEHFGADKQSGYYLCLNFEPWEGTQTRIKRSGSWGDWTTCKDNGDILYYLGAESIEATDIEVKKQGGSAEAYTLDITTEN